MATYSKRKQLDIKIIGLGGIGSILSEMISRYVNYLKLENEEEKCVTLIDGDSFEVKNAERQDFLQLGNKAEIKKEELRRKFRTINFLADPRFVDEYTISDMIKNEDIVLMGVDNHRTRKLVSDYCSTLREVTLISGGNEYTDGNVQLYARKGGEDITPSLTDYHPEIKNPLDKLPTEMSCQELLQSEPQLFFTNATVAVMMCWMFYNINTKNNYESSEVYFDMLTMSSSAKHRRTKTRSK